MNKWNKTGYMAIAALCMALAPAQGFAQDYLKGKTRYFTPEERAERRNIGDYAADFSPSPDAEGDLAARQRVEQRVRTEVKEAFDSFSPEDHDHREELTSAEFEALVEKAQGGDGLAIAGVGYAYQHGIGVARNERMAVEWYQRAIEYGMTDYYSVIGDMYRDYGGSQQAGFFDNLRQRLMGGADDIEKSDVTARQWYERGVYADDWQSYTKLAEMYRDGAGGLTKDMERAEWHYAQGMEKKKSEDALNKLEYGQRVRAEEERKEGLRDEEAPDSARAEASPSNLGVVVGDYYCALLSVPSPSNQYRFYYEAYCSSATEAEKTAPPESVMVEGVPCEVRPWPPSKDSNKMFELRCR